ncbi:MAG: GAF domain-containing protein, partial [Planctomycetota bacterium]|nr:GAF domain-containing protein [Planctomycetota bacterium]
GLSTRKLNEKIYKTIYYVIIPTGFIIIFGGICITFFLRRYIVSPIRQMASVTLDIAKGDLTRTVNIRSNDEIGQLSLNFNKMTKALGESYAELRYRARIEELIAAVSTNFINLAPDKIDTGINYALKLIGEFVGVDRSYVFLYADEEKKKMDNTHEWCADGIESQIENRKGLSVDRFPWGIEKLKRLETIHVPRVADLPDDANAEKELQQSQSVQSCVVVPMVYSSALVGVLGFDSIKAEKTWTEEDIALLKMAGEIFVNALEHKRAQEEIKHHVQRLTILHKIDHAIISNPDLNIILNVFLEQVTIQLGVDATNILILNSQTNKLECTASRGFSTQALSSGHVCPEECYAYRALLERRIVCISNMSTIDAPFVCAKPQEGMNFTTYNAVPLITKGQVKGVMELFHCSKPNMDNEWLAFVEAIGALAAIAIENTSLFEGLQRSHAELALAYDTTIEGWSRALDLRDKETEGHTLRVTEMTLKLARSFGVKKEELTHIRRGALLHDIGKMGIPDSILLKPDELTEEEWQIMRKHPEYAYQLLSPITYLHKALDIPYCHHEKWDGSGYPRGLKGEQIPLAARIFAVTDVWDALHSDRPYRPALPKGKAIEYIQAQSGTHFDPHVVKVFLKMSW